MPQLALNGTEIHYQLLGKGEPVIMIHGLLVGNMASWYFGPASALAKNFEVLVYDLRGHGMSAKSADGYTLEAMVADLAAIIREKKYTSVSLVGHSYGALIALLFALKNPHLVKKLVIIEAPLPPGRATEMDAFAVQEPTQILQSLPEPLRMAMAGQARQAKKFLERMQFLLFETKLLTNLKTESDVADEDLKRLDVPTLLIYGEQSQLGEVGRRLARIIPHSRLEWLDGGHYLPGEKPVEVTQKISEFLQ